MDRLVTDKLITKELTKLFYNVELLLSDTFLKDLSKAIATENSLKMEEALAELFGENMKLLSTKQVEGTDIVKNIMERLPQLKEKIILPLRNS